MQPHRFITIASIILSSVYSTLHADPGDFIDIFVSSPPEEVDQIRALTFGPDGNLYVAGAVSRTVSRYDGTTGVFIDHFVINDKAPIAVRGLVFGPDGNLYATSPFSVDRYNGETGAFIDFFVWDPNQEILRSAEHLTFGPDGNLYVTSDEARLVACYDGETGELIDTIPVSGYPYGLQFGPDGLLYVTVFHDQGPAHITRVDIDKRQDLGFFATGAGGLMTGLRFGPCNDIYAADLTREVAVRFDATTGEYLGDFTSGHLNVPFDLEIGPDRNLYVTSTYPYPINEEIVRFEGWDPLCGIPAVGHWALVILSLLIITAAALRLRRAT